MLYPAELQALPQAIECTLARGESRCLGHLFDQFFQNIGQKGIGEQQFFTRHPLSIAQLCQFLRLFASKTIFLVAKRWKESDEGNGCLNGAGPLHDTVTLDGNTHRSTGEWAKLIETATPIRFQGRAG